MSKLTRDGLAELRRELRESMRLGVAGRRGRVTVHLGTCGLAAGAGRVLEAARGAIEAAGVDDVELTVSGCAGLCCREPMATVELAGEKPVKYADLDEKRMAEVIRRHVVAGEIAAEYALAAGEERRA
jgi:NADP-reducing hydrogenase subunit HndB